VRAQVADVTAEQRLEALQAFGAEHGRHSQPWWKLREHLQRLNAHDPPNDAAGGGGPDGQADDSDGSSDPPDDAPRSAGGVAEASDDVGGGEPDTFESDRRAPIDAAAG
jgi:hypothetical protein